MTAAVPEQSDLDALPQQGMLMPELEPVGNLFPVPSTSSSEDVWNKIDPFQAAAGPAEQRNKRKSSTAEKAAGLPPNKKQRNVLKSRNKRL